MGSPGPYVDPVDPRSVGDFGSPMTRDGNRRGSRRVSKSVRRSSCPVRYHSGTQVPFYASPDSARKDGNPEKATGPSGHGGLTPDLKTSTR